MERLSYFALFCLTLGSSIQDELPIVNTDLGKVRGHYKYSYENRLFAAFEGIPYAKPPIGELRFSEPEKVEPWSGTLEATVIHECSQHLSPDLADSSEDCLYINVYVPRKDPILNENLDVIVHIHGGAFMVGSPNIAGPEFLMDRDVIYVNLNYRLGVFGFLSTGDDVVPGNNGLKDQVFALKWVKSNIKYFGGNPNSVTITGVSAGGACVHLHYFSNLSKGLFQRGISHSGTALSPMVIYDKPLNNAQKVAKSVGCTQPLTNDMVKCLKTKSAKELALATISTFECFNFPIAPFAPVVENPSKTAFLTEHPFDLLQKGNIIDVPWISSITADEGLLTYFFVPKIEELISQWHNCSPSTLNYFHVADAHKPDITKKISDYYFDNSLVTDTGIVKAVGDRLFRIPMEMSVEMQAKVSKSRVYSYIYSYLNELSFQSPIPSNVRGAYHASDGFLLYEVSVFPRKDKKLSVNDEWIKTFFVNSVTTFAKDGVPKFNRMSWEPVTTNKDWGYLHILSKNNVKMEYNRDKKLTEFWNSVACDYWNRKQKIKDEF